MPLTQEEKQLAKENAAGIIFEEDGQTFIAVGYKGQL